MKIGAKKRGLSPVIATVLLILLVVVLVSMLFVWARTFFNEQTEDSERPIGELCSGVYFTVEVIESGGVYSLEIINRGNVNISAFEIKMYSGGRTEISNVDVSVSVGRSATETFTESMKDGGIPERVQMFAVLDGSAPGKSFTCSDEPEYLVY